MRLAASLDDVTVELALPEGDHITSEILASGEFYETELLRYLRDNVKPGTFVDVGAHAGNHAVAFALAMASTGVLAIECNPQVLPYLGKNAQLSPKITVVRAAVHDEWQSVDVEPGPAHNMGMAKVRDGALIPCHRLDDLVPGDVSLVKIDVEGAELAVLRSARETLAQSTLKHVAIEVVPQNERGVWDILTSCGFERVACFNSTPTYIYSR